MSEKINLVSTKTTLSSEDSFTNAVNLLGWFNLSVSGTWTGNLTLQRSSDDANSWMDVNEYDSNIESIGFEPEHDMLYRLGFKTGDYTSGNAIVRLSK